MLSQADARIGAVLRSAPLTESVAYSTHSTRRARARCDDVRTLVRDPSEIHPSAAAVRPIERESIVENAAREIRRSVLAGVLRPGQSCSIGELSAQLHVSHIPVREALRRLESEGLVLQPGGRG